MNKPDRAAFEEMLCINPGKPGLIDRILAFFARK